MCETCPPRDSGVKKEEALQHSGVEVERGFTTQWSGSTLYMQGGCFTTQWSGSREVLQHSGVEVHVHVHVERGSTTQWSGSTCTCTCREDVYREEALQQQFHWQGKCIYARYISEDQ